MNHGQTRAELLERIREEITWDKFFGTVKEKGKTLSQLMQYQSATNESYEGKGTRQFDDPHEVEEEKIRLSTPVSPRQHY